VALTLSPDCAFFCKPLMAFCNFCSVLSTSVCVAFVVAATAFSAPSFIASAFAITASKVFY